MLLQQVGERVRIAAPEAAFGGDAGDGRELSRLGELPRVALRVALMHQPEIERRARAQFETGERAEKRLVAALPRHRHVDEPDRARDRAGNAVGHLHADPEIARLHHVLVLRAAVAQVITEIDVARHHVADGAERIEDLPPAIPWAVIALPHQDFRADIPLIGDLAMRQGVGDAPELGAQMGGVGRHEIVIGVGRDEVVGDGERRRHADLVLRRRRDRPLGLEPGEDPVIADRVAGIAGGEAEARRIDACADPSLLHLIDQLAVPLGELECRHGRVDFEVGMGLELVVDEADPAPAPAGLAVRQAVHVGAECPAHGTERGLRIRHRQAADHVHREPARRFAHRSLPVCAASVRPDAAACPAGP